VGFTHVLGPGEVDGGEGHEGVDGKAEFNEEDDVQGERGEELLLLLGRRDAGGRGGKGGRGGGNIVIRL
jgi:hypothetical protein